MQIDQVSGADADTAEIVSRELLETSNFAVMANQVRVSSGCTYAPGMINPDTGRMSWPKMVGHLGMPRASFRRFADMERPSPPQPAAPVYVPLGLENTVEWRLYRHLFDLAKQNAKEISYNMLAKLMGTTDPQIRGQLAVLHGRGLIVLTAINGVGFSVFVVEVGQTLKSRRMARVTP